MFNIPLAICTVWQHLYCNIVLLKRQLKIGESILLYFVGIPHPQDHQKYKNTPENLLCEATWFQSNCHCTQRFVCTGHQYVHKCDSIQRAVYFKPQTQRQFVCDATGCFVKALPMGPLGNPMRLDWIACPWFPDAPLGNRLLWDKISC